MLLLPRITGYLTVLGTIAYIVYLFAKDQKFKKKSIMSKVLTVIVLSFIIIWGLLLTTLSPESLEKARSSSKESKIETQEKLPAEKSTK
jgi:nitrate reductase gamma subunit